MTRPLAALFALASTLAPSFAAALPPDFDGERGIEAGVGFGYGTYVNSSVRLFQTPMQATSASAPPAAFYGGPHLRFNLGYRFTPYLSAGVYGQVQWIGGAPLGAFPTTASSGGVGVYARLYPMALINQSLENRRVRFESALDRRRLDPWVSLGVEVYQVITRASSDPMMPQLSSIWTRSTVGIPIAIGGEYRVIPALAVGLQLGITPLIGGGVDQTKYVDDGRGNIVMQNVHYDSVDGVNASFFVALSARYTFTF